MSTELIVQETPQPQQTISWGQVNWMIETGVSKMRNRGYHPQHIIPIGGGGIIPAAIMAYRFYKKDQLTVMLHPPVYARSYDHQTHKQHRLSIQWPEEPSLYHLDDPNTLFVDDICDTGVTLWAVRERMPRSSVFCLVTKRRDDPTWYSTLDEQNYWWNFPWEY